MSNPLEYPKGSVLTFTTGEYSDFRVAAYLVTVCDCDLPALAREYVGTYAPENEWDEPRLDGFASWLIAKGHAMPVATSEVHLGAYGDWEPEFGVPSP